MFKAVNIKTYPSGDKDWDMLLQILKCKNGACNVVWQDNTKFGFVGGDWAAADRLTTIADIDNDGIMDVLVNHPETCWGSHRYSQMAWQNNKLVVKKKKTEFIKETLFLSDRQGRVADNQENCHILFAFDFTPFIYDGITFFSGHGMLHSHDWKFLGEGKKIIYIKDGFPHHVPIDFEGNRAIRFARRGNNLYVYVINRKKIKIYKLQKQ